MNSSVAHQRWMDWACEPLCADCRPLAPALIDVRHAPPHVTSDAHRQYLAGCIDSDSRSCSILTHLHLRAMLAHALPSVPLLILKLHFCLLLSQVYSQTGAFPRIKA